MANLEETPDTLPSFLKPPNQIGVGNVTCRGLTLPYFILRKEAGPKKKDGSDALPGFMGYHQFPGDTQKRLFISEEVREQYREYVLGHEIYEANELQHSPHKCLEATMWEISQVPSDIKPAYIQFRITFFENLVQYNTGLPGREEFLGQITKSLNYLKTLAPQRPHEA